MLEFFEYFGITGFRLMIPISILIAVLLPIFYLLFLKEFLSALSLFAFLILWAVVSVLVHINVALSFLSFKNTSIDSSMAILFFSLVVGIILYLCIFFNALRSPKVEEKK